LSRGSDHLCAAIHADDFPIGTNERSQSPQVVAGSTTNVENVVAFSEFEEGEGLTRSTLANPDF
jgi:hypothetical protein